MCFFSSFFFNHFFQTLLSAIIPPPLPLPAQPAETLGAVLAASFMIAWNVMVTEVGSTMGEEGSSPYLPVHPRNHDNHFFFCQRTSQTSQSLLSVFVERGLGAWGLGARHTRGPLVSSHYAISR